MKVLYIIDEMDFGGAERQLVELVKGVSERGFQVYVVTLKESLNGYLPILRSLGVKVIAYPRSWAADPQPILRIRNYLVQNQIEMVHTFLPMGSVYGALAARLAGTPVVCSAIRDGKDKNIKYWLLNQVAAVIANIFVSNSQAGLRSRFSNMRPSFRVVYNGMDFRRFEVERGKLEATRQKLNIGAFQQVIGMVASLSEHKDHETLIQAAPLILREFPSACFLFVGDGAERERLKKLAEALGLKKHFIFLGLRADVDMLYHLMDVSVLLTNTRIITEGMPNAIIEAMACGVPVIASENGGVGEIINNGENGILIPPRNIEHTAKAIIYLLTHRHEAERLGRAGQSFVHDNFNLERYVNDYLFIYYELYNHKRKR